MLHEINAPTAILPSLALLSSCSGLQINNALETIRDLYFPSLAPSAPILSAKLSSLSKRHWKSKLLQAGAVTDSGYASAEEDSYHADDSEGGDEDRSHDELEALRSEPFERAFTIKWLTTFISRCSCDDQLSDALDKASMLLSQFSGDPDDCSESHHLTRQFSFPIATTPFSPSESSIVVELNDAPLTKNDHTSVGLQSWGSAIVLAERLSADPDHFGLGCGHSTIEGDKKILELGAGTGLLSIVAAKILVAHDQSSATVVASDYHPEVLSNLSRNISTNFATRNGLPLSTPTVHVCHLDWEQPVFEGPHLHESFNIILAADVIYHPSHASWIYNCVRRLLSRPHGVFWMVAPKRVGGRLQGIEETVEDVFRSRNDDICDGEELAILDSTDVGKVKGVGRADEGGYRIFKIGWI